MYKMLGILVLSIVCLQSSIADDKKNIQVIGIVSCESVNGDVITYDIVRNVYNIGVNTGEYRSVSENNFGKFVANKLLLDAKTSITLPKEIYSSLHNYKHVDSLIISIPKINELPFKTYIDYEFGAGVTISNKVECDLD